MKTFLASILLLLSTCVFGQSDSLKVTHIEFVSLQDTSETLSVLHIHIRASNPSEIGILTVDVLSASGSALLYKREYTRSEITSENLWTETGLLVKVPGLETGVPYEIRTTFQNLEKAFIGQLIDNYPF